MLLKLRCKIGSATQNLYTKTYLGLWPFRIQEISVILKVAVAQGTKRETLTNHVVYWSQFENQQKKHAIATLLNKQNIVVSFVDFQTVTSKQHDLQGSRISKNKQTKK